MTYFRTIVEMKNGFHKTLRLTKSDVAHVVSEFRKFQRSIFNDQQTITFGDVTLVLNEIISWKFINEWTSEEFLTLN